MTVHCIIIMVHFTHQHRLKSDTSQKYQYDQTIGTFTRAYCQKKVEVSNKVLFSFCLFRYLFIPGSKWNKKEDTLKNLHCWAEWVKYILYIHWILLKIWREGIFYHKLGRYTIPCNKKPFFSTLQGTQQNDTGQKDHVMLMMGHI